MIQVAEATDYNQKENRYPNTHLNFPFLHAQEKKYGDCEEGDSDTCLCFSAQHFLKASIPPTFSRTKEMHFPSSF